MNELRRTVEDLFTDAPGLKRFDTFPIYRVVNNVATCTIRPRIGASSSPASQSRQVV